MGPLVLLVNRVLLAWWVTGDACEGDDDGWAGRTLAVVGIGYEAVVAVVESVEDGEEMLRMMVKL